MPRHCLGACGGWVEGVPVALDISYDAVDALDDFFENFPQPGEPVFVPAGAFEEALAGIG